MFIAVAINIIIITIISIIVFIIIIIIIIITTVLKPSIGKTTLLTCPGFRAFHLTVCWCVYTFAGWATDNVDTDQTTLFAKTYMPQYIALLWYY